MKLAVLTSIALILSAQPGDGTARVYEGSFDASPARTTSPPSLRIIDWNIDRGSYLPQVVKTLKAQEADIALLQEVDRKAKRTGGMDITTELARRLSASYVFVPAFRELSQGPEAEQGLAMLAHGKISNPRILNFANQSGFWRPRKWLPNIPLMQRRSGGRVGLVAEVEIGGRAVAIYNVHLESRSTHIRDLQLEETIADAKRYPASMPVVLAGDLNTLWGTTGVRARLAAAGYRNCFGDRAVRTHRLVGALDYIMIRGPLECSGTTVVRGTKGSDHDPIVSRLTIGN